jgi:hypothetical protein
MSKFKCPLNATFVKKTDSQPGAFVCTQPNSTDSLESFPRSIHCVKGQLLMCLWGCRKMAKVLLNQDLWAALGLLHTIFWVLLTAGLKPSPGTFREPSKFWGQQSSQLARVSLAVSVQDPHGFRPALLLPQWPGRWLSLSCGALMLVTSDWNKDSGEYWWHNIAPRHGSNQKAQWLKSEMGPCGNLVTSYCTAMWYLTLEFMHANL